MPRGHWNETTIQHATIQKLTDYYKLQGDVFDVIAQREASIHTTSKMGSGRADGLFAILLKNGEIKTATVEVKSFKTLKALKYYYRDGLWAIHILAAGCIGIGIGIGISLFFGNWYLRLLITIAMFLVTGYGFIQFTKKSDRYKIIAVLEQVKRYPANEQWVAIPSTIYTKPLKDHERVIVDKCKRDGIGLIKATYKGSVDILVYPRVQTTKNSKDNYLSNYRKGDLIRKELLNRYRNQENDHPSSHRAG